VNANPPFGQQSSTAAVNPIADEHCADNLALDNPPSE
jgi:hypothetical protein